MQRSRSSAHVTGGAPHVLQCKERVTRRAAAAAAVTGLTVCWHPAFIAAPGSWKHARSPSALGDNSGFPATSSPLPAAGGGSRVGEASSSSTSSTFVVAAALLTWSAAAGAGAAGATRQLALEADVDNVEIKPDPAAARGGQGQSAFASLPRLDWGGNSTGWGTIQARKLTDIDLLNVHGILTVCALLLFFAQSVRIAAHQSPSDLEVWITTAIYLPWMYFCWRDTEKLENHYRVTFYASCGWGFMSLASLHSVVYQDKFPDLSFGILAIGNVVFAASCLYFYGYHWSRMWRHYQENRFRPLWIPGLLGLMLLHGLTIADFAKRLDDSGWWKTVCMIYPDEWWWVADVRIIELFVTAAALWLIVLHIQGVFTGMKNAALVVIGTIFLPLCVMVLESTWLRASSWQHYLMVGPKYW